MTNEIKLCPMCSHATAPNLTSWSETFPEIDHEGSAESYAVFCDASMPGGPGGCGASGGFRPTEADAIAAWNRRTPDPVGHEARRRSYQEGHRDGEAQARAEALTDNDVYTLLGHASVIGGTDMPTWLRGLAARIGRSIGREDVALRCEAIEAAEALATEPAQEPNRSQKMREAGYTRRPSPFGCEECGMVFGGVAQLQAHDCTKPTQEGDHV